MEVTLYNWGHLGGQEGNFGDKAMLETQLYYLSRCGFDKINIFSTDIGYTINRIQKFLSCDLNNVNVLKFPLTNPYHFLKAIKIIKNSDILIVGGGEIIYDESSRIYSILNLYPCYFNRYILFGVGATEDKYANITEFLLSLISKNLVKVFTRDIRSGAIFARYFDKKKIYDGTDIVFVHPYLCNLRSGMMYNTSREDTVIIIPRIHFPKSKIEIINFLPFKIRKYFSGIKEYELIKKKYFETIADIVNYLINEKKIKNVVIVPFSTKIGMDDIISLELEDYLNKKIDLNICISKTKEIEDFIKILSSSYYSIPSTYHGVITSAMCNTRTFAVSYSNKVNEICQNLSVEYVDIRNNSIINEHKYNFILSNKVDDHVQNAKLQYEKLKEIIFNVQTNRIDKY